jgi:peptidoglycan/xylan/chitin deacetylase (PgdA/CDA1 family)
LIYLLAAKEQETAPKKPRILKGDFLIDQGGIIRGDSTRKELAIVFTGDEFNDGGKFIQQTVQKQKIPASFFLTGNFYKNSANKNLLKQLVNAGHFIGNHSYGHLLYAPWTNRNNLLVNKDQFIKDLTGVDPYLKELGVESNLKYFLPPYEWYNDSISAWTKEMNRQLINYTPGTISHADYTTPADKNYRSSEEIYQSIINYEKRSTSGLNGFILLMHIGTDPKRTDKFYHRLPQLIEWLKNKGYKMVRVDELLD